ILCIYFILFFFFFFQAEDGIRDGHMTGVQTCALPISYPLLEELRYRDTPHYLSAIGILREADTDDKVMASCSVLAGLDSYSILRSEERRVGKECRARGWEDWVKKNE